MYETVVVSTVVMHFAFIAYVLAGGFLALRYLHVRPADQFDAMIHIDQTRALEPLEVTSRWIAGENPETYPTGL
ncbi:erythromycin esterase [Mycobacterium tuberculosis 2091HD]|nr:erythromycin esterase [Mycobacterium tuberculosis 2091HD]